MPKDSRLYTAISQIKQRNYPDKVAQYADRSATKETLGLSKNLLLVGINYDQESKQHECHIEKYEAIGI